MNFTKKKTISKDKKVEVWNRWIITVCYCCHNALITQANFLCGHVKSEKDAGDLNVQIAKTNI